MVEMTEEFEGFDRVFPLIGGSNQFQWLLFGVVSLQAAVGAFHQIGYVFLAAVPDHWCEIEELQRTNWTTDQIKRISIPKKPSGGGFENCEYYELDYGQMAYEASYDEVYATINFDIADRTPCTKWSYDKSIYASTTVSEFDLVCDRSYLVATIQGTYMAGAVLGSFVTGGLSDGVLGRRNVVLICVLLVLIGGFGAGLSSSYIAFVFCRFFIAMGVNSCLQNCCTLLMEYLDTSYRALMGTNQFVSFGIGSMIMAGYAYFLRDWSSLQLAFTATGLVLLSYYWLLPESSRWLVSKGREGEALKTLLGIAKRNKKPDPDPEVILKIFEDCRKQSATPTTTAKNMEKLPFQIRLKTGLKNFIGKYLHLVLTPELRKRSLILWILFVSVSFVYYGIMFSSVTLTNDPFLLVFLGGLMEIPGLLGVAPFVAKFGRKPTTVAAFSIAGASTIAVALIPSGLPALRVLFAMSGKLFITGCYGIMYVLGNELYPTENRATGLGIGCLMSRIGSILAPFVVNGMKNIYADLPSIIFGAIGIFASFIACLLPETKEEAMLETVRAVELVQEVRRASIISRRASRVSQVEFGDKIEANPKIEKEAKF